MEHTVSNAATGIWKQQYLGVSDLKHVFLVGDLQMPVPHVFVRDTRLEMIVCNYEPGDNGEFHWHQNITEYEMVLEGEIGYFDVGSGTTQWFEAGDLSIVPALVCVRRVVRRSARTLAIKVPSSNDKVHCDGCARSCPHRIEKGATGTL